MCVYLKYAMSLTSCCYLLNRCQTLSTRLQALLLEAIVAFRFSGLKSRKEVKIFQNIPLLFPCCVYALHIKKSMSCLGFAGLEADQELLVMNLSLAIKKDVEMHPWNLETRIPWKGWIDKLVSVAELKTKYPDVLLQSSSSRRWDFRKPYC